MENTEHFGSLTPRMKAFREEVLDEKPYVDAERAILATQAYRENQNQPRVMARARMLKNILEHMTIYIEDKTLLAGNQATKNVNAPIFPEYTMGFVLKELDFRQVSQLRYALELKSFTLAVQNATWQDLADLREIISQLDMGVKEEEENVLLDKRLHYTIARASGNMLFVEILQALSDVMDRFIADLRQDIMSEETRKKKLHDAHRRIVESIFTKDVAAGSAAVEEHFALIDQRLETRTQNRAES